MDKVQASRRWECNAHGVNNRDSNSCCYANCVMNLIESVSCRNQSELHDSSCTPIGLHNVQNMLCKCKKTAPGLDDVPYWFFRECWMLVAPAVTYLFNLSLSSGHPPMNWKKLIISPVPKTTKPSTLSDLRPITVTPILSRLFERCLVHIYILSNIPESDLQDQFTYRFTGSTTAALVNTFHHVAHARRQQFCTMHIC